MVALFHPRQQHWSEHFIWERAALMVRGRTPHGRATVSLLRLNSDFLRQARQIWVMVGLHPPFEGSLRHRPGSVDGARICTRMSSMTPWRCSGSVPSLAPLMNYADVTKTFGLHMRLAPIGSKLVQGQVCDGYKIVASATTGIEHGSVWLDPVTKRVVEEDLVGSLLLQKGSAPTAIRSKTVMSRYNDPTLTIPAVPAS